ncbi:PGF-pre-PGF domain-containing protein [Methanolobus chelungpuianus]|uniref:PGF-pre-PGF domain-containing protein n=1 Tax=Methanolobus chelungpuianus TaxID=502115 RepID=UPI0021158EDC|nr:PGF-pre-PGF domain-containing protein [Methanolobus chelungpuianus]
MASSSGEITSVDFNSNVTSGNAPLTVAFTGVSESAIEWDWDFGDGSTNSTAQNPFHTYNSAGIYTVTLTAVNENGTSTESKTNLITVLKVPTYSVSSAVDGGTANIGVDRSTAKEGQTVNVTISDIQAGKQFAYIKVTGENNQVNATEVIPGVSYTFNMPAENVTVTVALKDTPVTTYGIQTEVIGGNATVTTDPATAAEKGTNVIVTISNIEPGKQFNSITVRSGPGKSIETSVQPPEEVYTFTMPEKAVTVTVVLEDSPVSIITVTGVEAVNLPTKENYIEGETLNLSGLLVRLIRSDGSTVDVAHSEFAANGLTTIPSNGDTLSTANTTITIAHADRATATLTIKVNAAPVPVTQIVVTGSGNSTTVEKGKTLQMSAAVLPESANNKNVVWSVVKGSGTASVSSTTGLLTGTGAGTVTVVATAADGSGVQGALNITITEAQSATTASSGGGGGGGSQNTGEKNENIELKDYSIKYVLKDTETLFEFAKEGNSVISLGYTASLNGGQTKTVIEMLKGTSTLVNKAAPGTVYKNVNIWVGDGKAPAMLSDARIMFRVEKSWLSENRIDPANIRMCRYNSGSWAQLPTSMTGEDDTYVYYLARTPGFSAFAISSISEAQQAASTGIQQGSSSLQEEGSTHMSTADSKAPGAPNTVSQEAQSAGSFMLLLIIAVTTAVGILSYRHRDYLSQVRMQLGNPDGKRYRRLKKYN